jgi:hypothetical protein
VLPVRLWVLVLVFVEQVRVEQQVQQVRVEQQVQQIVVLLLVWQVHWPSGWVQQELCLLPVLPGMRHIVLVR